MAKSVYLIVSHVTRIAKGIASHKKGVANDPNNYETFENMIIADRVSNKNMLGASVVIDLLNGAVVKNRFEVEGSAVFREYVDKYQSEIGEALKTWGIRDPDNYKKLKSLAEVAGIKTEAQEGATDDAQASSD